MEGKLHIYHPERGLNLFEYTTTSPSTTSRTTTPTPSNVLLFVGGLFDNFQSPLYVNDLAALFPRHESQKWTVMHIQLSSAMRGFGVADLNKDIDEIATGIDYIRNVIRKDQPGGDDVTRIVLMGHSTGCQDTLHYLHAPNPTDAKKKQRPKVQGAILQAPVSDRDAVMVLKVNVDPEAKMWFDKCTQLAVSVPEDEHLSYMLPLDWTRPLFGAAPLCISRFLDLASPSSPEKPRIDDMFSSDLSEARLNETFGRVGPNGLLVPSGQQAPQPSILVLISSDDERISHPLKTDDLLSKWSKPLSLDPSYPVQLHQESKLIQNAEHDISGDRPAEQHARLVVMRQSVLKYLDDVVGGIDETTWSTWTKDTERVRSQ